MPVRTDDPSDSQAPTRIGRSPEQGEEPTGPGPAETGPPDTEPSGSGSPGPGSPGPGSFGPGSFGPRSSGTRPSGPRSSGTGRSGKGRSATGLSRAGRSGAPTSGQGLSERRSDAPVVLDRYRLRRRLGTGGFATVWLARDQRLDRDVAIKILPRERVVGGRFEREARAAARLAHPGIVTLYEAAVDDEGAYLVSELVHGSTLDRMLTDGLLSDRDVVQIGIALCDALSHAHAHGVIHRDVKPSNVLVPEHPTSPAGLARLTDFGVARVAGGDALTMTGDVIGTAAYMAPEQAQGLLAGAPADLFSLALVVYEGLTGVNPVRTGAAGQSARRLGMHLPPLRRQRRDLPRELGQAIDLALRPRPGERGRIEELRVALATVAGRVRDDPGVVAEPWRPRTTIRRPDTDEVHLRIEDHRRRAEAEDWERTHPDDEEGREPRGNRNRVANRAARPENADDVERSPIRTTTTPASGPIVRMRTFRGRGGRSRVPRRRR